MSEKVITIATSRDTYNIADAVEHSITVEELIDELRHLPGDCKIVLKNDGGYTYGAISTWDIDSEWLEDGDAEDDFGR